jgi:5-methylcytosine-specific restriction endonuclease McrA
MNNEEEREYKRLWNRKNYDKIKQRLKERKEADPAFAEARRLYQKAWRNKNSERIEAKRKERMATDPEYAARQRASARIQTKKYREKYPEKQLKTMREWRSRNKEKRAATRKAYQLRNHKKELESRREYYQKHKAAEREYSDKNRRANLARYAAYNRSREARKKASACGDRKACIAFRKLVKTKPELSCYWCGKPTKIKDRHVDHIIPLSRGGPEAITNLCCACAACNHKKWARTPQEFTGQHLIEFPVT